MRRADLPLLRFVNEYFDAAGYVLLTGKRYSKGGSARAIAKALMMARRGRLPSNGLPASACPGWAAGASPHPFYNCR